MSTLRVFCLVLLAGCAASLLGQDWASLAGTVVDPSEAVVPDAKLTAVDLRRGTVKQATTNEAGSYAFALLEPGEYTLEVAKEGFNRLRLERIRLSVRDRLSLRLRLEPSPAQPIAVKVIAELEGVSSDMSMGAALHREYAEELPLSRRSALALVPMAPGTVSAGRSPGEINVDGLRSNTNYYTMDGVSLGMAEAGGGGGPMLVGDMISMDSMQEVRVQTSAIAPEFGRSPGAQISLASRAGGNGFHGSLSEYLQNDYLDANDWFANANGIPRPQTGQNRFGARFGGRLKRDATFFFGNYDGSRNRDAATALTSVPSLTTRASAPSALKPYLMAFPIPNGANLKSGAAQFTATAFNPSRSDAGSLRLDHRFRGGTNMFLRYVYNSSDGRLRGPEFSSPNILSSRTSRGHVATAAVVSTLNPSTINDLRVNVTTSSSRSFSVMDSFGSATPLTGAQVFPKGIASTDGSFQLSPMGVSGYFFGEDFRNRQRQLNVVEGLTTISPSHQFKVGVDYRRSTPAQYNLPYSANVMFQGLSGQAFSLLSGTAASAVVTSYLPAVYPSYVSFSFYGQDSYRATDRTTLIYGLRWDINPAPGVRKGPRPLAMSNLTICQVTQNEPLYSTRWFDIAPRLGLAYQMDTTQGREMMFRAGAGMFYDVGYGQTTDASAGAPYAAVRTLTEPTFPLSTSDLQPPSLPPTRPYGLVSAADALLMSPVVFQWDATLERWFGRSQSLSVGYVGSKGRRLLRVEVSGGPVVSTDTSTASRAYDVLRLTTNGADSNYHGLQVQYRRMLSRSFQTQASYTFGHSIDSGSRDMSSRPGFATLFGIERGDSDYDIRHNVSVSGSYRFPGPKERLLSGLFGDWWAEWMVTAHTALPFDVLGLSGATSQTTSDNKPAGMFSQVRPSLTGAPIWILDPKVPGGRRLNPGAFLVPEDYSQGTLGRNLLRGFGLAQLDLSIRKQIALGEQRRLQILVQAFNVMNHPNFANPSTMENANSSSPNFGVFTHMAGSFMGMGSAGRMGAARSMQVGLRLEF